MMHIRSVACSFLLLATACCNADEAATTQRLFVIGGTDPRISPQGQVAAFTLNSAKTNGSWAPSLAMGSVRESGRAGSLNGSIYHVGGASKADYPYLNSTLRYTPGAPAWTPVAPLPCDPDSPAFCPDVLPGARAHRCSMCLDTVCSLMY